MLIIRVSGSGKTNSLLNLISQQPHIDKIYLSLVFITQSYFALSKNVSLNSTHYFIMKIRNRQELQQIAFNGLSDIDFKDFMNLY